MSSRVAATLAIAIAACSGQDLHGARAYAPPGSGIDTGRVDPTWATDQLRRAAIDLDWAFTHEGSEGLQRLRVRGDDVHSLFSDEGARRLERLPRGLTPSPGEQRWRMFASLVGQPVVGFCARGVRIAERNGPDGLRDPTLIVDRLLIVGQDPGGYWAAWIEGLALTNQGWRLLPTVPFDRQVETPRRDHADVTLWDCDIGQRPQPGRPL